MDAGARVPGWTREESAAWWLWSHCHKLEILAVRDLPWAVEELLISSQRGRARRDGCCFCSKVSFLSSSFRGSTHGRCTMPVSRTSHLPAAQTQVWVGYVLFGQAEGDAPRQPKHVMQAQRQKDHPYSSLNLHFTFYDKAIWIGLQGKNLQLLQKSTLFCNFLLLQSLINVSVRHLQL